MESTMKKPMFALGHVVGTPGAVKLLKQHNVNPADLLARHVTGDWGVLDPEDTAANNAAVVDGSRLLSAYEVGEEKVWIITEWDRSVTTLLLPSDY
jgi:hypothetical protein